MWKVAAAASLVAFLMGWSANGWRMGEQIATIQADYNAQVADANAKTIAAQQEAQALGDKMSDLMMKSQRKSQAGTNLIRKDIDNAQKTKATTCVFDAEWVRLYNAALNPDQYSKD